MVDIDVVSHFPQKTKNLTLWVKSAIQQSNFCNVQNLILPRIEKEPEKKKNDKGKKLAECCLIQNSLRASLSPDWFPALFDTLARKQDVCSFDTARKKAF